MKRCVLGLLAGVLAASVQAVVAPPAADEPGLDGPLLVARNAAARGGVEAWKKITEMAWSGRVETATRPNLPFVLEQKRPGKSRFEITADQQKTVRVFDGSQGWKLKFSATSPRPDIQPFSADEVAFARNAPLIDGPLMDFAARGYPVVLEAPEQVQGKRAYRLRVEMPSGQVQRVWVDARSYLEIRLDRPSRGSDGRAFTVSMYFDNYKSFDGLTMPMTIETRNETSNAADRIIIERIALNPTLEDRLFEQPRPTASRRGVIVDTRVPPPGMAAARAAP